MRKKGPLTEKPCFLFLENKNVLTSTLRDLNNSQCLDLNLPFVGNLTAMPSDAPVMQASQDAVDTKSARQGQFQEKKQKTPTSEMNIFLPENIFDRKNYFWGISPYFTRDLLPHLITLEHYLENWHERNKLENSEKWTISARFDKN